MWQRELQVLAQQLLEVWSADVVSLLNLGNLEDVDASESSSVTGSHILVECMDSVCTAHLTVLLVHVVCAGTRVVSDPNTEVLDLLWVLLVNLGSVRDAARQICITNLVERHNLAICLLDLSKLGEEVPESTSCNYLIWRENSHAVELWCRVCIRRQVTPNDLVFLQATCMITESALSYGQNVLQAKRNARSMIEGIHWCESHGIFMSSSKLFHAGRALRSRESVGRCAYPSMRMSVMVAIVHVCALTFVLLKQQCNVFSDRLVERLEISGVRCASSARTCSGTGRCQDIVQRLCCRCLSMRLFRCESAS